MIFSRLFAPSHTSQNPEKRREAIKNLSPEKPTDKTLLHELAFNDENADVSLDALNKLGSFVLWQKMSQIAKHERVQRTANKVVLACLMGEGEITISRAEKAAFLKDLRKVFGATSTVGQRNTSGQAFISTTDHELVRPKLSISLSGYQ